MTPREMADFRRRVIEECASVADEYAHVNMQMAGDTILHDPVLSGRDRSEVGFARSEEMRIEGAIHSAAYHAATNIAAALRAIGDAAPDGGM